MKMIDQLRLKKKEILDGPSPENKKKHFYDKGMFPPRERLKKLLDPGSFLSWICLLHTTVMILAWKRRIFLLTV
jgi:acetyl-CoA carboxylase carboxyltransferase component